jgi:aminopeptidase
LSETNTKALSNVDSTKSVLRSQSRNELMKIFMKRSAAGELHWVVAPYPTNALAQDAEMSLTDYEDFVYGACLPDVNDPIGYWQRFSAWQQKIVNWLKGKQTVRVIGRETDLRLRSPEGASKTVMAR